MSDDAKQVTVRRTINAPAKEIYELLTNPERHPDIDASGMVRSLEQGDRLEQVGQQFKMNMFFDKMGGDYQMSNHVTGLQPNRLVAWQPSRPGDEPAGWEWMYELESDGAGSTEVTLTYDWSKVTDKKVLERVRFPVLTEQQLEDSLAQLASAVGG